MSNPNDYTVGWICAITTEYVAAQAFLDEKHDSPIYLSPNNKNEYTLGKVGKHNVVIAVLPRGEYGTSSAARVAEDMLNSFPNVRIGLMVGIGGGAPSSKHDIRLGDIVVSDPCNGQGGVFQYDFGKSIQDQAFQSTGFLNQPPVVLRAAVTGLEAHYEAEGHQLEHAINIVLNKKPRLKRKYKRPDSTSDRLYQSKIVHLDSASSCAVGCGDDPSNLILRSERTEDEDNPMIHYGLIASANQLMKDALIRDKLAAEKEVLCFEMEAGGLMNHFPCLVIRGICDYADSHKNKDWQGYAAMVAAAYTKDLLYRIVPQQIGAEKTIRDLLSTVNEIQKTTQDINVAVKRMNQRGNDQDCRAILDWLIPTTYSSQQHGLLGRRQEGTGKWLVESKEFKNWVDQKKQILFCPGIPGAGKTIATCIVVDYLLKKFQNDSNIGIAYLYCDFRRQEEQDPTHLVMSLLRQFAGLALPETVRNLYNHHTGKKTRPSFDEALNVLNSVVSGYSRAYIMIDALDECKLSDGVRFKFISVISKVQANASANIFVTSRLIPDIQKEFQQLGAVSLEISANDEDVGRYLDGHISQLPSFVQESPELTNQVKAAIIQAAEGMFLLAILNLGSLEDKINYAQMENALQMLPKGLGAYNEAYKEAMERIQSQKKGFKDLAIQALSWITCAKRPLTTLELQHALAVIENTAALNEQNITEVGLIASVCAGLVTIDEESNIIRLVHYTTQEYFERTWKDWFPDAQTYITKVCISYLSFDACRLAVGQRLYPRPVFYHYAGNNWGHHARVSLIDGEKPILDFLEDPTKVSTSADAIVLKVMRRIQRVMRTARSMAGLHLAAYFGLWKSTAALLERQNGANSTRWKARAPFLLAAENGHETGVKPLLDEGADIESKDDAYDQSPLFLAADNGHETVVKLLLDEGADIESKDNTYDQSPLSLAAESGHETVVKLLLDKGADIESKDLSGQSPLSLTAKNGHKTVLKLLLDKGADIESKDDSGRTPLSWATRNDYEAKMKILFNKVSDTESQKTYGQSSLSLATENGHKTVLKLLLDKGADIESKDGQNRTPLSWAARNGFEATVKLLLDEGADTEFQNAYGQSPLSSAAENGHETVVKLLLDKGAGTESQNAYGRSPLSLAAERGHETVVKLLLDKGADIEFKDISGQTPLSWAARNGFEATVKLLLDEGANIESQNAWGHSPLSLAAENGHEILVKLLLDTGADTESKDGYDRTPLSWAAKNGRETAVKLLLDKGADIESKDNRYRRTPLLWAAEDGHETVVRLLLDKGADIESQNAWGHSPLSLAAENGHETVVKLLLDKGADIEAKDTIYGQTPLSWAAGNGHDAVVKLLLENGADPGSKDDKYGRTPASFAAWNGHQAVMKILSAQPGANPSTNRSSLPASSYLGSSFVMAVKGSVREEEEFKLLLPSQWCNAGKSPALDILNDGLEIRYMGLTLHFTMAGVRSDYPMPRQLSFYYFEVTIIAISNERAISIGVSSAKVFSDPILLNMKRDSWDYLGNDGRSYAFLGLGRDYGPTWTVNDTVGCGVNFTTGYSFFTKNGTFLETSFQVPQDVAVYPSVSMKKFPGTHLSVNFGQEGFVFDIDGLIKKEKGISP